MKFWKKFLFYIVLIILLIQYGLPYFLSPILANKVSKVLSKPGETSLSIGSIILSPLLGIIWVKEVQLLTSLNNRIVPTFTAEEISIKLSLYELVKRRFYIKNLKLIQPSFNLITANKTTNMDVFWKIPKKKTPSNNKKITINSLIIKNGKFSYIKLCKTPAKFVLDDILIISEELSMPQHLLGISLPYRIKVNAFLNGFQNTKITVTGEYLYKEGLLTFKTRIRADNLPLVYLAQFSPYREIVKRGTINLRGSGYSLHNLLHIICHLTISNLSLDLSQPLPDGMIFGLPQKLVSEFLTLNKESLKVKCRIEGPLFNPRFSFEKHILSTLLPAVGQGIINTIKDSPKLLSLLKDYLKGAAGMVKGVGKTTLKTGEKLLFLPTKIMKKGTNK